MILDDGSQLGVMSTSDALKSAELEGLDLVEISPNADPPVAKIIDWGKYNYQRTKQAQKQRKAQKPLELKQMRFGLKIGDNDLNIKLKKVREFLDDGHMVRLVLVFRGRELAHKELGYKLLDKVIALLSDVSSTDQKPQFTGKQLSITLRSTNAKVKSS